MLISRILEIADNRQRAEEIQERVQKKRETGEDTRSFGEILQEELDKIKATNGTAK